MMDVGHKGIFIYCNEPVHHCKSYWIILRLRMGDIEVLCCNNHPLKSLQYHNYCNIHLVGYKITINLKLQSYGIIHFKKF